MWGVSERREKEREGERDRERDRERDTHTHLAGSGQRASTARADTKGLSGLYMFS